MQRRTAGAIIVITGIAFVVTVFGNGLFGASSAFERLSDDVRPVMSEDGSMALRADVEGLRAVSEEFAATVIPTVAGALGISEAELAARFASDFPATARGVLALPGIVATLDGQVALLEGQIENFERADAIPTTTASTSAVPWFILLTGIAAIAVGVLAWRPGRWVPYGAVGLGALMLAVPISTSMIGKSGAADELNDRLRPVFTSASVERSIGAAETLEAMAAELEAGFLPTLSAQLGLDEAQSQAFVRATFPAVTGALATFPSSLQRLRAVTASVEANLDRFTEVSRVQYRPVAWTIVAGGLVVILAGAWAVGGAGTIAIRRTWRTGAERTRRAA